MDLKDLLELILLNVIMHHLDRSLKLKSNVVENWNQKSQRRIKKLSQSRSQTKLASGENPAIFICKAIQSFSSYYLTTEEGKALSFSFDEHIQTDLNHNKLFTETFY